MTKKTRTAAAESSGRPNAYEMVTGRILEALSEGVVPWRKPWRTTAPRNLTTQRPYRGLWLLTLQPFASPYWLTFRQALALGGHVKRGEHGTPIVFWKILERADDAGELERVPLARTYTVFNAEQCEGIVVPELQARSFNAIEAAQAILDGIPAPRPTIQHGGSQAYYSVASDRIQLPPRESFDRPADYYGTAFHEAGHATGHPTRLGRFTLDQPMAAFRSPDYSKEELIAEMTSAFLSAEAGILEDVLAPAASYIHGRMSALKDDAKLVVHAAAQAQKATDWVLGRQPRAEAENGEEH
jgi:antirestriction protein ArdC